MRKSTGMRSGWIATALVVLAALVLAGCPHNGFLERGGGAGGGSSRGGGGEVTLTITNFVDGGPVANRSALSGSMRTIAPEHIDLTVDDEIDKYVFVAYATGDGTWGPEFIDIASGTGAAALEGLGGGTWLVTLEAYDVTRLQAAGVVGDKAAIMQGAVTDVTNKKADALVLSGGATVDTNRGVQVTLTLTKDTVEGNGTVDVAVYFTTDTDVKEIFKAGSGYKVTAQLMSPTGQPVQDSEVVLWQETAAPAGVVKIDTDPNADYTYRKHNPVLPAKYEDITIRTIVDQKKVLAYKPTTGIPGTPLQIPAGRYLLRVTVETPLGDRLYRSDPDFFVDPQRTVKQAFEITALLGTPPKKLEKFGVYWQTPSTTDQLAGYTATFVWEENDFNAAGYTIQIADITDIYKYENSQSKVTLAGGDSDFNNSEKLWLDLDGDQAAFAKYVTTLDWQTTPQANQNFPKWQSVSLLQGNSRLDLRLASGRVYAARIRASNGTSSHSDWSYLDGVTTAPTAPQQPVLEKFEVANTKGIFALTKIAYNLLGTMDMYTLTGDRNTNWRVNDGGADTKVEGEALLQVEAYTPGTSIELEYGFEGETVNAANGDQVLTVSGNTDIVKSWIGWQDTSTNALFGPASNPTKNPWAKADWIYEGYADLNLKPVGAGGSTINTQTETAGTFDVISENTVGFSTIAPDGSTESKILRDLTQFTTGQTTPDIYRNASTTRLVAVIGGNQNQPTPGELYVSVGENNGVVKSLLKDKNGNPIKVVNLEAQVFRSNSTSAIRTASGFTPAEGDKPPYVVFNDLGGLKSGDSYTLKVRITTGQGFTVGTEFSLTILYEGQVQNATIP